MEVVALSLTVLSLAAIVAYVLAYRRWHDDLIIWTFITIIGAAIFWAAYNFWIEVLT